MGLVGLVEDGRQLGSPVMRMMSGACPPPAPSAWVHVDGATLDGGQRLLQETAFVQRVGVELDLKIQLVGDVEAGVD